jgi:acyl carrier protein
MPRMSTESELTSREALDRLALRLPHLRYLIRADQPLAGLGLGLDSIDLVELLCVIEGEFDVSVTEDELTGAGTVGELAELICRRTEERRILT